MRAGHFSMLTVDTYLAGKVSISWYRVLGGGRRVGRVHGLRTVWKASWRKQTGAGKAWAVMGPDAKRGVDLGYTPRTQTETDVTRPAGSPQGRSVPQGHTQSLNRRVLSGSLRSSTSCIPNI